MPPPIPLVLATLGCFMASSVVAQTPTAPHVAGFERFHRSPPDASAEGGRVLLQELGCTACHASDTLRSKRAPMLGDVGGRVNHEHLMRYLADPAMVKPGTTMPRVLGGSAEERRRKSEALTHYLVGRSRGRFKPTAPDLGAAARGERLFHQVGCVACHAPQDGDGTLAASSVPLPLPSEKYTIDGLRRFLERPLDVRPSGRMPDLALTGREAFDIASFLLQDVKVPGTWRFASFHGRFETIDDVGERAPDQSGMCEAVSVDVVRRKHQHLLRFEGFLRVERPGPHRFTLECDDAGRISVDGKPVVDLPGNARDPRSKTGTIALDTGWHPVVVEYLQRGGPTSVAYACANEQGPFRGELRAHGEAVEPHAPLVLSPELEKLGEQLYASEGCQACHEPDAGRRSDVPRLDQLPPAGGCLEGQEGVPDYGLDDRQRAALQAALGAPPKDAAEVATLHHRMVTLNCYACHERDGVGGVPEAREDWFTDGGVDQGLEGRIPPPLTGIGDKLRPHWVRRALEEGVAVRPLIHTRMPRYGRDNVAGMTELILAQDAKTSRAEAPAGDDAIKQIGRALTGRGGFNCVACHRFNTRDGASMQMVDLTLTTDRVHYDWFVRWMKDPGKLRPGTRMPSYTALTKFLDGDLQRQIDAVWSYLSDGRQAIIPEGVSHQAVELVVGGEAIVYRGKLREAGFRGIAVAHPEQVNFSFDAAAPRYVQLWKGRFMNVTAHWRSQGMGRVGPAERDCIPLPKGPMWARLDAADAPWPTATGKDGGFRFGGYRLDALRRPTFRYRFGDLSFQDGTIAPEDGAGLNRTVVIAPRTDQKALYGVLARHRKIESEAGSYVVDGRLRLEIRGARAFIVGDDVKELRIAVPVADEEKTVKVNYRW